MNKSRERAASEPQVGCDVAPDAILAQLDGACQAHMGRRALVTSQSHARRRALSRASSGARRLHVGGGAGCTTPTKAMYGWGGVGLTRGAERTKGGRPAGVWADKGVAMAGHSKENVVGTWRPKRRVDVVVARKRRCTMVVVHRQRRRAGGVVHRQRRRAGTVVARQRQRPWGLPSWAGDGRWAGNCGTTAMGGTSESTMPSMALARHKGASAHVGLARSIKLCQDGIRGYIMANLRLTCGSLAALVHFRSKLGKNLCFCCQQRTLYQRRHGLMVTTCGPHAFKECGFHMRRTLPPVTAVFNTGAPGDRSQQ
ncbi:hypothetical protein FB451DRAFT_1173303 [Mycena latifolia]|nr:hypothetical protein FB451DRAFT_1173303 [Mycena latifolia]